MPASPAVLYTVAPPPSLLACNSIISSVGSPLCWAVHATVARETRGCISARLDISLPCSCRHLSASASQQKTGRSQCPSGGLGGGGIAIIILRGIDQRRMGKYEIILFRYAPCRMHLAHVPALPCHIPPRRTCMRILKFASTVFYSMRRAYTD